MRLRHQRPAINNSPLDKNQSGNKRQEHASVCICPGCLVIRGYASAAEGTLVRQSSNSALHVVGGSISRHPPPTENKVREPATTGSGFEPHALAFTRSNRGLRH
jgi:hypothetical protein